jgi:beta-lactamase regulating signal transducer with metallopeptidase domain
MLMLSLIRARTLARTADDGVDEAWRATADSLGARLGLSRPARLLMSPAVGTPMAGGVWRPAIFLPESARTWNVERRTVVLAHEIAHLAAHDPLRHVAARLAVALYWFHPLVWIALRRLRIEAERACDDAVLREAEGVDYAEQLVQLARRMSAGTRNEPTLALRTVVNYFALFSPPKSC